MNNRTDLHRYLRTCFNINHLQPFYNNRDLPVCFYLKEHRISDTLVEYPQVIAEEVSKLIRLKYGNIFENTLLDYEMCKSVSYNNDSIEYKTFNPIINKLYTYDYLQKFKFKDLNFYLYRGSIYNEYQTPLIFFSHTFEYNKDEYYNKYEVVERNIYINPIVFTDNRNPLYKFIINTYIGTIVEAIRNYHFDSISNCATNKVNIKIDDGFSNLIQYINEPTTIMTFDTKINDLLELYKDCIDI